MNNRSIQCEQCETTDNVMTVDNKADEEDRDIQTYISTMQSKYNLCQLCAMSEFFKRCPGCNVDMGSSGTAMREILNHMMGDLIKMPSYSKMNDILFNHPKPHNYINCISSRTRRYFQIFSTITYILI